MTKSADFNAEEWATVVDGPIYAALRVIAASHGGRLRESFALARAYQDARAHHGESELLDELVKSPPAIDADELRHAQSNIAEVATQQLRDATGIVGAKAAPAETDSYKTFVMTVAQAVASAHKEGGFSISAASRSPTPRTKRSTQSRAPWGRLRHPERSRVRAAAGRPRTRDDCFQTGCPCRR